MTEDEVIRILIDYLEGLFPKSCSVCMRQFPNLRDYFLNTKHVGSAMSYDAEMGNWHPENPIGTTILANCSCGNTLSLSSIYMPQDQLWQLLDWIKIEIEKRGVPLRELLNYLRDEICKQVISTQKED